ncbi:MAG: ATP-binding protein [Planctomycetaceae bacterium]
MFRVQSTATGRDYRLAIAGLLTLSVAALAVTVWVMVDFLREQEIVRQLIGQLPPEATESARELAGELRWQFRLTILVVLNLVVTGFAMLLLWRAYNTSQDSLRDIKALAADVLDSMDLAIITTDVDGLVTSINRRGLELLSLTDEQVGRPLNELSDSLPLEDFRQESRSIGHEPLTRDFNIVARDNVRTLRAFCQPLRDRADADIGNIVQLRDVTERILMDDRLRRMERYMGLGSLAAGLHHEIKNPLAALSLHVQLLEEQLDDGTMSDEARDMLGVIRTEVTRVGGVLEGFRDFASLGKLNRCELNLAMLIDRQVKLVAPQASRLNIDIHVDLPPEPLPIILADRVRLEQVLLNLLVNAMESMPEGGPLRIHAAVSEASDPACIRVAVIDAGVGIPENLRDRILDPYFTTKSNGTGMGLALCEKIIRQHHGNLEFRSSSGGTTFEFTLPIQ